MTDSRVASGMVFLKKERINMMWKVEASEQSKANVSPKGEAVSYHDIAWYQTSINNILRRAELIKICST